MNDHRDMPLSEEEELRRQIRQNEEQSQLLSSQRANLQQKLREVEDRNHFQRVVGTNLYGFMEIYIHFAPNIRHTYERRNKTTDIFDGNRGTIDITLTKIQPQSLLENQVMALRGADQIKIGIEGVEHEDKTTSLQSRSYSSYPNSTLFLSTLVINNNTAGLTKLAANSDYNIVLSLNQFEFEEAYTRMNKFAMHPHNNIPQMIRFIKRCVQTYRTVAPSAEYQDLMKAIKPKLIKQCVALEPFMLNALAKQNKLIQPDQKEEE